MKIVRYEQASTSRLRSLPKSPLGVLVSTHIPLKWATAARRTFGVLLGSIVLAASTLVVAQTTSVGPKVPTTNDGHKWRVATYEGGPYINYRMTLEAIIDGLMRLGWVDKATLPAATSEDTKPLWDWLVAAANSEYIEFVKNGHYSAKWDDSVREQVSAGLIERLASRNDIDLIVALGTWAGKDLANNRHSTATIVTSTTDPISAGIIKSAEDSGFPHLHARVDPRRYERQLTVFHEIIRFKKLGVAFENSINGRIYAAMDVVERLATKRGFEVVECHTQSDVVDKALAEASVVGCFKQLAGKVDAFYVTEQGGVTSNSVPSIVDIANAAEIATFSQGGSNDVRLGVLLSLSRASFRDVGVFYASVIANIFNGVSPGQIPQVFEERTRIAINLQSAKLIGFEPPTIVLGAAEEVFEHIESSQ